MVTNTDIENAIVDRKFSQDDRCILTLRNGVQITGHPGIENRDWVHRTPFRRVQAETDARNQTRTILEAIYQDRCSADPVEFQHLP